ncbi:MAG: PEP-CTERM sorting domain-containing protein [Phycisphaerales bacterium]|nr:PEP-CTERM sorting domain-containing protein [Phycisphaerales bacterium]
MNGANAFGFRFIAADGLTHYGYGVMTIGANMGVRTLTSVSYESIAGVGITVVSVPAPGALALLGLAGFAGRRRRS